MTDAHKIVLMFAEQLRSLGGIEQSSVGLARILNREFGRNIDLIFGEDGDRSDEWVALCKRRLKLGSLLLERRHPLQLVRKVLRSVTFARQRKPDVIYCQSMHQLPLGRMISIIIRRPLVLHLRTEAPRVSRRNRVRIRSVHKAISVSTSTANDWMEAFPWLRSRTIVIPNGIDLDRFRPITSEEKTNLRRELEIDAEAFVVAFIGRFSPEKAPLDLIQAVRSLDRLASFQLVLVGDVDQRRAEYGSQVVNSNIDNMKVLPARPDIERVIQAADLVVVPSHTETFGRVVIESLACGVMVFGARVGGIAELLGETPDLLFTPGDVAELGAKIADVVARGKEERERSSATFRALALPYSETLTAERVDAVLMEATLRGPTS